ncbi:MAG: hypothetical protein K2X50_00485 [Gammaproteobacteria bacterium]|nr:hypothetical protein [Gammaproteobacteria bacterium]
MAKYILGCVLLVWITSSMGDVSVRGYTKSDGTYVAPHYRSDPNGNFNDNWSTKPNVNPYTGQEGSKANPNYGSDSRSNQPNTQPRSNSSYDTEF